MFLRAIAAASRHALGLAPQSSANAAAAIAAPEPTSAWHPPAAPEMLAFFAIMIPTAPAVNSPFTRSLSVNPCFSLHITSTAGSTPLAPAVGVATILPIEALTSVTAIAAAQIFAISVPIFASGANIYSFSALSPARPVMVCCLLVRPSSIDFCITIRFSNISLMISS